jgi:sensor histidine kinase YesM
MNSRPEVMHACQLLSRAYHYLNNNDSAYTYLEKYVTLKDSIQSKQFLLRIYNSKKEADDAKKESRIGLLNRDNQIKQQQLKQEATFRNFIITAFVALLFAGLYVFRNVNLKRKNERLRQAQKEQEWKVKELENENKHVELQKQSAELEMQALRAQMNPHFIFNSLSSINHFILKNESKTASNYLTRFSRLIRMVLINSQKSLITLEDELQMLDLYLEMERLRFKNSFDYSITFLNTIDSDNIFIPPLLLQPFCENAIWHGLMHKEGQGRLDIELSMSRGTPSEENKILNCTITDNGIGRERAEEMKSKSAEKEKSMGLKITQGRLNLLNQEKGIHTFYNIEDLKDAYGNASGTRVNLKISYQRATDVVNT